VDDLAPHDLDLVIVGAGPYGLSIAAHARQAGLAAAVFGDPMRSWREHMPDGMHLETEGFGSNLSDPAGALTLEAYCAAQGGPGAGAYRASGWPVPAATFAGYATWFQEQAGVLVDPRYVAALEPVAGGHRARLADGEEVVAATAVVALGMTAFPSVAPPLLALPASLASHASQLRRPADLAGRRVAVVGGGQSALESAALVAEAGGDVTLLVRGPSLRWHAAAPADRSPLQRAREPRSMLGDGWLGVLFTRGAPLLRRVPPAARERLGDACFAPAGAWWLRDRVEAGVDVRTGVEVTGAGADGDRVALQLSGPGGAERLVVDHVISATGYRPDLDRLPFELGGPALRRVPDTASPVLSSRFESSAPGLCFTGALAAATFGRGQTFLPGASLAARRVTRAAAARRRRGADPARLQPSVA
jgi:lysine/ornithine N-monooxygenase